MKINDINFGKLIIKAFKETKHCVSWTPGMELLKGIKKRVIYLKILQGLENKAYAEKLTYNIAVWNRLIKKYNSEKRYHLVVPLKYLEYVALQAKAERGITAIGQFKGYPS